MDKLQPDNFFNAYQGRYSQYWVRRWGLIPSLPTSFDNANDIYELLAWLQRGFKQLLDDFANLELEFEEFKNAIIELLEVLIPQLIREFAHSEEFRQIIYNYIRDFMKTDEFIEYIKNIIRAFIKTDEFKNVIWDYIRDFMTTDEFIKYIENIFEEKIHSDEFIEYIKSIIDGRFEENIHKTEFIDYIKSIIDEWYKNNVLNREYVTLVKDVDYTINYHNGFYSKDAGVVVNMYELGGVASLTFRSGMIANDDITNNVRQNHAYDLNTEPKSAIFSITFIGGYSYLNSKGDIPSNYNNGSGIWYVAPTSERASWQASYNIERGWSGNTISFSLRSYADGFNSQFDVYGASLSLTNCVFNYALDLV